MDRAELKGLLARAGFAHLGHSGTDAVYAYDLDGNFIDANDELFGRVGQSRSEMEVRPFGSFLTEPERAKARTHFDIAAHGAITSWTATAHFPSGISINVSTVNIPFVADGQVVAVLGIVRDLHQLERSRKHAHDLESQLEQMLDAMPDLIYLIARDWSITFVNRTAREAFTDFHESQIGKSMWEVFKEVNSSDFAAECRAVMAGSSLRQRRRFSERIGRWVDVTIYPTAIGIAIFARDVDTIERERQERVAAEKRTATQAALLDAASDAMVVRRLDGTISYWNRAAHELYGWTEDEALNAHAGQLLFDDPRDFEEAFSLAIDDGYWFGTVNQRAKDGRALTVEARWTLIRDPAGEPESVFSVSTDVTDKRREELLRLRAQRLESLGTLAGAIAHDLNNVLTPILMAAQILRASQVDESSTALVGMVERSAHRGADLIRQVLTFARGESGEKVPISLYTVLVELERFCRETLPPSVEIEFVVPLDPLTVLGDTTQLTQVLINTVVNARDAMPDGGHIRVTASRQPPSSPDGTETIVIAVSDSGVGMDANTLESVFEPFFTTKSRGSGTGLGLATSLAIVQHHGGTMLVQSEIAHGTTFSIELPSAAGQLPGEVQSKAQFEPLAASIRGKNEIILVVDDEKEIRQVNCRALEAAGYRTLSAANGERGVAAYLEQAEQIRLVLTDMTMPVMGGAEMCRELRSRGYTGPIVATSGATQASAATSSGAVFLAKPYTAHALVTTVSTLIENE